ncbi:hypothetical protein KY359_04585 [Candidatus Woesearchaeota archaeon]|nr:hypothetical protein [Candidatus Woesearchaeota archaeon]
MEYSFVYNMSNEGNTDNVYGTDRPEKTTPVKPIGKVKLVRIELDEEQARIRRLVEDYLNDKDLG